MSIPEATQLVLEAGLMGEGGEIFVLDMGEPMKRAELAGLMIRLSGADEKRIRIEYTGVRAGEKLYEEVLAYDESTLPTPYPRPRVARAWPADPGGYAECVERLEYPGTFEKATVRRKLKNCVPEYQTGTKGETRNPDTCQYGLCARRYGTADPGGQSALGVLPFRLESQPRWARGFCGGDVQRPALRSLRLRASKHTLHAGEPLAKKLYPQSFYRQFGHVVDSDTGSRHPRLHVSALGLNWHVGLDQATHAYRYDYDHLSALGLPGEREPHRCGVLQRQQDRRPTSAPGPAVGSQASPGGPAGAFRSGLPAHRRQDGSHPALPLPSGAGK